MQEEINQLGISPEIRMEVSKPWVIKGGQVETLHPFGQRP